MVPDVTRHLGVVDDDGVVTMFVTVRGRPLLVHKVSRWPSYDEALARVETELGFLVRVERDERMRRSFILRPAHWFF